MGIFLTVNLLHALALFEGADCDPPEELYANDRPACDRGFTLQSDGICRFNPLGPFLQDSQSSEAEKSVARKLIKKLSAEGRVEDILDAVDQARRGSIRKSRIQYNQPLDSYKYKAHQIPGISAYRDFSIRCLVPCGSRTVEVTYTGHQTYLGPENKVGQTLLRDMKPRDALEGCEDPRKTQSRCLHDWCRQKQRHHRRLHEKTKNKPFLGVSEEDRREKIQTSKKENIFTVNDCKRVYRESFQSDYNQGRCPGRVAASEHHNQISESVKKRFPSLGTRLVDEQSDEPTPVVTDTEELTNSSLGTILFSHGDGSAEIRGLVQSAGDETASYVLESSMDRLTHPYKTGERKSNFKWNLPEEIPGFKKGQVGTLLVEQYFRRGIGTSTNLKLTEAESMRFLNHMYAMEVNQVAKFIRRKDGKVILASTKGEVPVVLTSLVETPQGLKRVTQAFEAELVRVKVGGAWKLRLKTTPKGEPVQVDASLYQEMGNEAKACTDFSMTPEAASAIEEVQRTIEAEFFPSI